MTELTETESAAVTEEDVIIQTPNGERYPATEIDLTGHGSIEE